MSANAKTIPYHIRLPNELFWAFIDAAKEEGEDRAVILRRMIREFVRKKIRKTSVSR